jgi:hypothetical protein
VPIATNSDQRAVADAVRAWAAHASPRATARAQESVPDAWRKHWAELADLGLFAVALPEGVGGGGTVADLAVMLEAAATALVPGPVVSTALAGLVLARSQPGSDLLAGIASGSAPCGTALGLGSLTGVRHPDGSLTIDGLASALVGVDQHSMLLLGAQVSGGQAWFLLDADVAGLAISELAPADFSRGVADVALSGVLVAADRVLDGVRTAQVRDLAAVLFAAEAAGVASWCLQTAVEYAKIREQFGKPIGAFQAVKHLCAEMLCRVEVASALAGDAALVRQQPRRRSRWTRRSRRPRTASRYWAVSASPGSTTRTCTCAGPSHCASCWAELLPGAGALHS